MRLIHSSTIPKPEDVSLLERRYRGESPLRTFFYLYRGDWHNLFLAVIFFIIKHSGVWAMPVVTARIVDVISRPESGSLQDIAVFVGILLLIFLQNIPMHYLFVL